MYQRLKHRKGRKGIDRILSLLSANIGLFSLFVGLPASNITSFLVIYIIAIFVILVGVLVTWQFASALNYIILKFFIL